jgi:hypothetical protein
VQAYHAEFIAGARHRRPNRYHSTVSDARTRPARLRSFVVARRARAAALALVALIAPALPACTSAEPVAPDRITDPSLRRIHASYVVLVRSVTEVPNNAWRAAWMGNLAVNLSDGTQRGLCWHWRDLVYFTLLPTIRAQGWDARGIIANWATPMEHNAVVVFDPSRISAHTLLTSPPPRPAWVLDAWERAKPDLFTLDDWLDANPGTWDPPTIVDLEPSSAPAASATTAPLPARASVVVQTPPAPPPHIPAANPAANSAPNSAKRSQP